MQNFLVGGLRQFDLVRIMNCVSSVYAVF